MQNNPIGIFDSGIGGTSIWREIIQLLPNEDTVYLADSKNAPYGEKSKETILELSRKNTEFLMDRACKIIVVACNTATTNAIANLRAEYSIPFIGIEPAIKPAALNSTSKTVGVLATKGTLASQLFSNTASIHAANISIIEREGTGLVELIESGELNSARTEKLLEAYLEPMLAANMDHLVLGCTHYPYLIPALQKLLPKHVEIIDCGNAVARQTKRILERHDRLNNSKEKGNHRFFTNSDSRVLKEILSDIPSDLKIEEIDF